MQKGINVLALFAHPDDAEFLCAGTLAHLADRGAQIHIATMTAGDCGSTVLPALKIAGIRRREAVKASRILGGGYTCLKEKDLLIFYDRRTLAKVMELVRRKNPALVITHSPQDYMVDHETVSRLCQTACLGGLAPNFRTGGRRAAQPLHHIPHLYYAEPFGGRDILGTQVHSRNYVNIAATLPRKEQMLACHESQLAFLSAQQGIPDILEMARSIARGAGERSGLGWAEGFRQHLGQGFPSNNLLGDMLNDLVRTVGT